MDPRDFPRHLRNNATPEERALWNALSTVRPRFTRQLRIHPHVADLACRKARLVVEIDGGQHAENLADTQRTADLEAQGWRVIRFWNSDVQNNLSGVVEAVLLAGAERMPPSMTYIFTAPRTRKK